MKYRSRLKRCGVRTAAGGISLILSLQLFAGTAFAASYYVPNGPGSDGRENIEVYGVEETEKPEITEINYENLRQLLQDGSLTLQNQTNSYYTNLEDAEYQLSVYREEYENMKFLRDQAAKDDPEKAVYRAQCSVLLKQIQSLEKQIEKSTKESGFRSTDKTIDSAQKQAQQKLLSAVQAKMNYEAAKKNAEAAEASYHRMLSRQTAGSATAADVLNASDQYLQKQNSLTSAKQTADSTRFALLSLLGFSEQSGIGIGGFPEPDLEAIAAVDLSVDIEKAVGNNRNVQNTRHGKARTETDRNLKESNEISAEGTVRANVAASYEQLQAKVLQYRAACDSYESARMNYDALVRKQNAGMLSPAEYLTGEAAWLTAQTQKETASMNLVQAFDEYRWLVKGVN